MDKFIKKTKGAISIFLVLVMLPMLSIASLLVDMSRINLARSMGASAGDLTLNTALTNYDSELKSIYGLFATAQNMDEMMVNLEDYYRRSIEAAGVDEDIAKDFAGQIMNVFKEKTGTDDIMNIKLSGLDVEAPTGANLGNPAMMKSQIVEFMKYRAPLNLGMGLLESLSSMKNLNKQMDVVEKKNTFYKDHQTMLGKLEDAWKQIQTYQFKDSAINFPNGKEEDTYIYKQEALLNTDSQKWGSSNKIVENTIRYVYNTGKYDSLKGYNGINYQIETEYVCKDCVTTFKNKQNCTGCGNPTEEQWMLTWDGERKKVKLWQSEEETTNANDVLEVLNSALTAMDLYDRYISDDDEKDASKKLDKLYKAVYRTDIDHMGTVEKIYLVNYFNTEIEKPGNILTAGKSMLECLVNLKSVAANCDAKELESTKVKYVGGTYKVEMSSNGPTLKKMVDDALKHLTLTDNQHWELKIFNEIVGKVQGCWMDTSSTVSSKQASIASAVTTIRDHAVAFEIKIKEKIGNLESAITYLDKAKKMITGEEGTYKTNQEAWNTSAQNLGDDTMGQRDQDELNDLKKIVTKDNLEKLITRLSEAKNSLDGVLTELANYTIAGKPVKDIKVTRNGNVITKAEIKYTDVVALFSGWDSNIKKVGVPTSDQAYDEIIKSIVEGATKGNIATSWDKGKGLDLAPDGTQLYAWLYNNYYEDLKYDGTDSTEKKTNSADGALDKAQKNIEGSKAEGHKDAKNVTGSAGTPIKNTMDKYLLPEAKLLPSTRWGDIEEKVIAEGKTNASADGMMKDETNDNLLKTVMNLASDLGEDLRNTLYISEYMMTMFSYDTLETELYDKTNTDSNKEYEAFYEWKEDKWQVTGGMESYAAQLQTLTKVPITPEMNYLYRNEVEYIVYGQGGTAKVYGTIFALRFALNTVYAFMDAEINNVTLSAATALFGTPPLTPLIPIAKIAMTIALALAESGWDLNELSKGKAIPLMKNKDTWIMSPSGIASNVKKEAVAKAKNLAEEAIDKGYSMLNSALQATSKELDEMIQQGALDAQELAEAALSSATTSLENYANQVLQKAVELCNQVNQEYMLKEVKTDSSVQFVGDVNEKVKIVEERLKQWLDTQTGDQDTVGEAKQIAYDYILDNSNDVINTLFTTIEQQCKPEAATDLLDKQLATISREISIKISDAIAYGSGKLSEMKNELVTQIEGAMSEGAEKLKTVLSEKLDSGFNQIPINDKDAPKGAASGVVSSLLSWRYSDYLRILVTVGLFANEKKMLLRIADLIERNMQYKNSEEGFTMTTKEVEKSRFFGLWKYTVEEEVAVRNEEAFTLEKSYTYIKLKAHLQVKPLLMTLPFMAETVENSLTGTNWYEVTVTSMMGY